MLDLMAGAVRSSTYCGSGGGSGGLGGGRVEGEVRPGRRTRVAQRGTQGFLGAAQAVTQRVDGNVQLRGEFSQRARMCQKCPQRRLGALGVVQRRELRVDLPPQDVQRATALKRREGVQFT